MWAIWAWSGIFPHHYRSASISGAVAEFESVVLGGCHQFGVGTLIAWVIVRYDFPGKSPHQRSGRPAFCLAHRCLSITLATLYAPNGWDRPIVYPVGIKIAFTPLGIFIALIVVSLPFVVRTSTARIGRIAA